MPESKKPITVMVMRHGGSHLIKPIVRYLTGLPIYSPKGQNALTAIPSGKLVVFPRDPRSRAISGYRYKLKRRRKATPSDAGLARYLSAPPSGGIGVVQFMREWAERWMYWPGAMMVRFEDLVFDPASRHREVVRLGRFLSSERDASEAISYAFETSHTFTGKYSTWDEWAGPLSREAWEREGGDDVVRMMGYDV